MSSGIIEQRRLAAIMFTDLVGYSALTQKNEELALKLLGEHRELVRPVFVAHNGTEVKTMGDGFLVEFGSPLDAVRCAIEIQKRVSEGHASSSADAKFQLRIGLHLGDIVHRENDVFGDGVNIASRIEALAKPGGICLSQQIYDQVQNKVDGIFVPLGAAELKNIQTPVKVYRLVLPWQKKKWSITDRLAFALRKKKARFAIGTAAALLVSAGMVWLLLPKKASDDPRALVDQAKILAAHSSSHLEGRENNPRVIELLEKAVAIDPRFAEAQAELALAYVIRLFLYAPEDKQLEEKAYLAVDRALSLNPNLPAAYLARGRLKWTPFHHFPHEAAIEDFKHAIALNPNLDDARHYLGLVYLHIGLIEKAQEEFRKAVVSNPSNNGAQYRFGEAFLYEGKYREARNVFEKIDADFNPELKESQLAWALSALGQKEEAAARLEAYLQEHPEDSGGLLAATLATISAARGDNAAAENYIRSAETKRGYGHFHHTEYSIACAYALMNNAELAVEWLERTVTDGLNCYPLFQNDPNLANVRSNARFEKLMQAERTKWEDYRRRFE